MAAVAAVAAPHNMTVTSHYQAGPPLNTMDNLNITATNINNHKIEHIFAHEEITFFVFVIITYFMKLLMN